MFVDRGWIPDDKKDLKEIKSAKGEIRLTGILKRNQKLEVKKSHMKNL